MDSAESVTGPVEHKRLAVILSVDAAGYSARSEQDEAAAVRVVQALARQVEDAALAHGGRVFNSAGDGFMLEFPTVSGALAAARAIVQGSPTPVRVGAHLGEATVTPTGDLLGHGVNVAARLQALARPGSVLVSDAVRRAVTRADGERFRPQGRVRLDKMSRSVEVFTLDIEGAKSGIRRRRPWLAPALAALGALAVAGAGLAAWRMGQPRELRVAVEPIVPQGKDAAAAALVDGLAEKISAGLADHGTAVVPAQAAASSDRAGARLIVGGEARRAGDTLTVDIRLEDRRGKLLLWSSHFEQPMAEAAALDDRVTAKVVDVVSFAADAMRYPSVRSDSRTLSVLLKLADLRRDSRLHMDQLLELDRQMAQLAPGVSEVHAALAVDLASLMGGRPPAIAKAMTLELQRESAEARRLDPHNSDAYASLYVLFPPHDYAQRAALLAKGMAADPQGSGVNAGMADFLRELGRNREAEPFYRRAQALDPLSPPKAATLVFALAGTGRAEESWGIAQRALAQFPTVSSVRKGYAYTAALYQPPDVALQAIDRIDRLGGTLGNGGAQAWRDYVNGARRGHVDPAAIGRFREAALKGVADPSNAAPGLAMAGDVDGAFAVYNKALDEDRATYPSELFEDAAAPMRSDPRFEALVKRLGILDYWKSSRVPPDFCREPNPAPICKTLPAKS
ncbi:MAG TPA: hypothetical protein VGM25_16680 [Caulobacteraceae bacterium]|jgi:adenylate cyclase